MPCLKSTARCVVVEVIFESDILIQSDFVDAKAGSGTGLGNRSVVRCIPVW